MGVIDYLGCFHMSKSDERIIAESLSEKQNQQQRKRPACGASLFHSKSEILSRSASDLSVLAIPRAPRSHSLERRRLAVPILEAVSPKSAGSSKRDLDFLVAILAGFVD
jgi:hypothetical protein